MGAAYTVDRGLVLLSFRKGCCCSDEETSSARRINLVSSHVRKRTTDYHPSYEVTVNTTYTREVIVE